MCVYFNNWKLFIRQKMCLPTPVRRPVGRSVFFALNWRVKQIIVVQWTTCGDDKKKTLIKFLIINLFSD